MDYEITKEQSKYLKARGYTILTACPGSGKTTSIVYKLLAISHECVERYGTYSGVACLSFTNKACEEILGKYKEMHGHSLHKPHIVSTIDSFITQYITLPFWYLYPNLKSRPLIINDDELMDKMLKIQYNDNGVLKETYDRSITKFRLSTYIKYPPTYFWKEYQGFSFRGKSVENNSDLHNYATAIFNLKVKKGFINSQDASFIGCYILYRYENIAKALARRFPYLIIDEAQDTSEIHHKIFDKLKTCGTLNIEYVGDLYQSIYQWRNARPELLENKINSNEWNRLYLTENRRSNQRIIDLYSLLRNSNDPKIISHKVIDKKIDIVVYRYDNSNIDNIINDFNSICNKNHLKDSFVLTRGNSLRNKLLGTTQELNYWKSKTPYLILKARSDLYDGSINDAFNKIRQVVADSKFQLNEYLERKDFLQQIEFDILFNSNIMKFILNIPSLDLSLEEWTTKTESLMRNQFSLLQNPDFQTCKKISGKKMKELKTESVNTYYSDKAKNNGLSVKTIHKVKGATSDAVLLFLDNNSSGKSISLKEFEKKTNTPLTEKQRLIYVACSRATQFLAFAIPATISEAEIRKIFGSTISIKNIELQGELF